MQALSAARAARPGATAGARGRPGRRGAAPRASAAPVQEVLEGGSAGFAGEVPPGLNKYSGHITQPKSQGASQAMLYATGLTAEDMGKPQARREGRVWGRRPARSGARMWGRCAPGAGPGRPGGDAGPNPPRAMPGGGFAAPPPAAARRPRSSRPPALRAPRHCPLLTPAPAPASPLHPRRARWASAVCGGRATPATCT